MVERLVVNRLVSVSILTGEERDDLASIIGSEPENPSSIIILLLYVDDIILTGSHPAHLTSFISTLSSTFAMKDLGFALFY